MWSIISIFVHIVCEKNSFYDIACVLYFFKCTLYRSVKMPFRFPQIFLSDIIVRFILCIPFNSQDNYVCLWMCAYLCACRIVCCTSWFLYSNIKLATFRLIHVFLYICCPISTSKFAQREYILTHFPKF